jgi:hypothetical protein
MNDACQDRNLSLPGTWLSILTSTFTPEFTPEFDIYGILAALFVRSSPVVSCRRVRS